MNDQQARAISQIMGLLDPFKTVEKDPVRRFIVVENSKYRLEGYDDPPAGCGGITMIEKATGDRVKLNGQALYCMKMTLRECGGPATVDCYFRRTDFFNKVNATDGAEFVPANVAQTHEAPATIQ